MKRIFLTTILAVALLPIISYNVYKYRSKQCNAFEQH